MTKQPRSLPQATPDLAAAMALVCTIPVRDRGARSVTVQSVISQAMSSRELGNGVAFRFEGTDNIAQLLLELASKKVGGRGKELHGRRRTNLP